MVKANSLIYAVYVCVIVAVLCGALLYIAGLYNSLNQHYNALEDLYTSNRSAVNFALSHYGPAEMLKEDKNGITSEWEIKPYGIFEVLSVHTFDSRDTVSSSFFTGKYDTDDVCIFLSRISPVLSYSGKVKLLGRKKIPAGFLQMNFLSSETDLNSQGEMVKQEDLLPESATTLNKAFTDHNPAPVTLSKLEKTGDSIYFNSFSDPTVRVGMHALRNISLEGNIIVSAPDTLTVGKNAHLQNIILKAPVIIFEDGFKGCLQAIATQGIVVGKKVKLDYPSALCLMNNTELESSITMDTDSRLTGTVILSGSSIANIYKNQVLFEKGTLVTGNVYCSGKICLKGRLHGSVYTNRFFYGDLKSGSENSLVDTEIDVTKRPSYFIGAPLFGNLTGKNGIVAKVR